MTDEQPPITPPSPPVFPPPPDPNSPFDRPAYGGPTTGVFPLDIGRAVELTFSLYRNRWRTLVGIGLVLETLAALGSLLVLAGPQSTLLTDFSGRTPTPAEINALLANLLPTLLLSLAFFVVAVLVGNIQMSAMTDAVGRIYAGRPVSAWASLKRGLRRWLTFVALMLWLFLGVLAVFLVGVVILTLVTFVLIAVTQSVGLAIFMILIVYVSMFAALIFVAVRWSMAVQIVMIESVGARAALGRSWRLIAGSTWRVIGYYLAFWLVTAVVSLIIGTVVNIVVNPYQMSGFRIVSIDPTKLAISTALSSVLGAFVAPLTAIPAFLLYLDLRFRHGDYIKPPGQGSLSPSGHDGSVSE